MRAIFMFHNCEGQSHKTVSTDHNFWRETWAEADSNRGPSAYQPNALPLGQTGSRGDTKTFHAFITAEVLVSVYFPVGIWAFTEHDRLNLTSSVKFT